MRLFCYSLFIILTILQFNPVHAESTEETAKITSFMTGLQTEIPKQAVELWILGVKNRSGAVQYAELSPLLQKQTKKNFQKSGWVTGQSSPWIDNFHFDKVEIISNTKQEYTLSYDILTSFKKLGKGKKFITVEKNPTSGRDNWFISNIKTKKNQWEAFTPAETLID
ncbi:hypothetical protein [Bacillus thuringiensis]|uniref:hypothetical protein n=1 Tax=Bacillus thuringiensis TaxID=1428 RepID=UPI0005CEADAB|nr:hypothetical protein [Bacillus thuringiensis]